MNIKQLDTLIKSIPLDEQHRIKGEELVKLIKEQGGVSARTKLRRYLW